MTPTQSPSMASQATAELPKLPVGEVDVYFNGQRTAPAFTADQMQAYGLACYEAGRASRAQSEPDGWRAALEFYAEKSHFTIADEAAWDTVSGEPANFWCDEEGTATVEDGTVAAMALAGTPLKDEDDEPATTGETK